LLPVQTTSFHWIAPREFATATGDFLERETRGLAYRLDELNERAPFKHARP
jgi:predicted N-acyltransferase